MAPVSDTRYKQRAVIEFLLAEKEMWGIFTNGCVLCMEVVQSIEAPLDAGLRELRLQEVEKLSCMIVRGLGALPQTAAQTCSAPMTLFMRIGASQVGNWPYSFQSAMELQWQLLTFWDIRRCKMGSSKSYNRAQTSKKAICSELLKRFDARAEAFLSRIITADETCPHHYKPEMKRQSVEWHHL
jgi:hypothetical protein